MALPLTGCTPAGSSPRLTHSAPGSFRQTYHLTQDKKLSEFGTFREVVQRSLINGYLLEDGDTGDDTIDLTQVESGILEVTTNSQHEMDIVLSRLRVIEKSLSRS